jgi:hypothetical protein
VLLILTSQAQSPEVVFICMALLSPNDLALRPQLPVRSGPDPYANEDDYRDWSEEEDASISSEEEKVCLISLHVDEALNCLLILF